MRPNPFILVLSGFLLLPLLSCDPILDDDDSSSASSGIEAAGGDSAGDDKGFRTDTPKGLHQEGATEPKPSDDDPYLKALPSAHSALIRALGHPQSAAEAREKLASLGKPALGSLQDAALLSTDPVVQGWAVEVISHIDDERADRTLELIHGRENVSKLVRTWAAAARVRSANSLESLAELSQLASTFPALKRPLGLRAAELVGPNSSAAELITLANATPALAQAFGPAILSKGAPPLMDIVLRGTEDPLRRTAAGYVGALGGQGQRVAKIVAAHYAFTPNPKGVPWQGGALYVPNLTWQKEDARVLVSHLIEWHLYCDLKGLSGEQRQLYNNLRSIQLYRPAGLTQVHNNTHGLLHALSGIIGRDKVQSMLARHGAGSNPRYDLDRAPENRGSRGGRGPRRQPGR